MAKFLVLLALFSAVFCRVHFDGEKVFRVTPKDSDQVKLLRDLQEQDKVDFWTDASFLGIPTDIRVPKDLVESVEKLLNDAGVEFNVLIEDLEKEVAREEDELTQEKMKYSNGFNYYIYNHLEDIHAEVKRLVSAHSDKSQLFDAGTSYEGRKMLAVKIATGKAKPVIWIDGCIHSREWISCASVMNLLKQLLQPEARFADMVGKVLDKYDFYILPVFNVDGYHYTHHHNRMWRKTRSRGKYCFGADPNRNWDSHWGGIGTSSNECSDTYHGKSAFSEIEVAHVAKRLKILAATVGLKSYWNIHAYSQLVLYPWSYTTRRARDYIEIDRIAKVFAEGIREINGKVFQPGQPSRILYSVSGGSMDYTYEKLGVKYSYAPEMRPRPGEFMNGFLLPAKYIRPSEVEFVNGILKSALSMR